MRRHTRALAIGLTFTDASGTPHDTHRLTAPGGCGFNDPDHSFEGGRAEFDDGRCDGWLRAAQTDRTTTSVDKIATMPAIWDSLSAAGVAGRYFYTDVPYTALWGTRYLGISRPILEFYAAAAAGALPAVSFVEPGFLGEAVPGLSEDEHPLADIRLGQHFLGRVHDAVVSGPDWERTVLVITYDEWGGFFDHVAPSAGPDPNPDLQAGLRGFRVPCIVISPRARRGHVAHNLYDHTSILKMIEWRFGLSPLTVRDAAARNLAEVLDFESAPNLAAPRYNVPLPITFGCLLPDHAHSGEDWPASPSWRRPAVSASRRR